MKKYLLPENGRFYKANLHAHSTGSDGKMPPERMKTEFKKRGYDVLCITEHEILKNYNRLSDDDFLFLNGYELSVNVVGGEHWVENKCCHLNLYSSDPTLEKTVCFNPKDIWFADEATISKLSYFGDVYERKYTPECINDIIKTAKEHGFIVCLNHPTWSLEEPSDYLNYEGLFAMEVYNTDCIYWGHGDFDLNAYDFMCKAGKRLGAQMADDNHNSVKDDEFAGTFGGFDMIKAEKLTYECIFEALKNQNFYSSNGPIINELYVENDMVHITCEAAKDIIMTTGIRTVKRVSAKPGEHITKASFELKDKYKYVRFEVVDENLKRAVTRAYFSDEWK